MLKKYIHSLIDNTEKNNIPKDMNLIIDGGAFTGAQTAGCLYYIKELEKLNITKVNKISGCSIGSLLGYMYLTDTLEYIPQYYKILLQYARKKVKFKKVIELIESHVKKTDYTCANNRLFISYNNIDTIENVIISEYKSEQELIDYIIRSSFLPFIINGKLRYKEKYCDGFLPYLFNKSSSSTLFISLINIRNIKHTIYSNNDNNIWNKLFDGVEDINLFFKENKTASKYCSFIEKWQIKDFILFRMRELICLVLIIIIKYSNYLPTNIYKYIKDNIYYKRISSIVILLIQNIISYNIF